jgi:hypothetical protein
MTPQQKTSIAFGAFYGNILVHELEKEQLDEQD